MTIIFKIKAEKKPNNNKLYLATDQVHFLFQEHPAYDSSRCKVFHADITNSLTENVPVNSVDIATMIFVLSAIHPNRMIQTLRNVFEV